MNARHALAGFLSAFALFGGCNAGTTPTAGPTVVPSVIPTPRATNTPASSVSSTPNATAAGVRSLSDGPLTPGTYLFTHQNVCDDPPRDCPAGATPPPALGIELTVPTGWEGANDFYLISPVESRETGAPNSSALVMGWTNFWVGLNSEPCSQVSHQRADIEVGPSVDDFVEAVVAHPKLDITDPLDVQLGGYSGRFFTLTGPPDISGCEEWRPWDPGFFAQGPNNLWDVWVMDVNGFRIAIVTQRFPETPADVTSELRQIVESIRFVP